MGTIGTIPQQQIIIDDKELRADIEANTQGLKDALKLISEIDKRLKKLESGLPTPVPTIPKLLYTSSSLWNESIKNRPLHPNSSA